MINIIWFLLTFSLVSFTYGLHQVKAKNNPYGLASLFSILGIFVWGDALIIAPFWIGISIITLITKNIYFFGFITSIFWVVRSLGEIIYWLNQQFSARVRDKPETVWFYPLIKSDAVWFMFQVIWQIIAVISIVSSVYFGYMWIQSIS